MKSYTLIFIALLLVVDSTSAQENDDFSLEDLMQVEVVSSNKFAQELSDIPAAVYIISKEDISKSHASNLPDLLQNVPGLMVAQASANNWAIGSRGFSGVFANKLLVMVDGRSLFSPLFSGVFWDMLDIYISDIERIEVIRGAGSSVWGANATNGIINIITKSSVDTKSTHFYSQIGEQLDHDIGVRQGFELSERVFGRIYAKQKKFASNHFIIDDIYDNWQSTTVGGRLDGFINDDSWSFSGDYIDQETADVSIRDFLSHSLVNSMDNNSWNVSGSWQRILSPSNQLSLSIQFQQQERSGESYLLMDNMLNSELDHSILLANKWQVNYGVGYRRHDIDLNSATTFLLGNETKRDRAEILSTYGQVLYSLDERQSIQIGTKVEQHQHKNQHNHLTEGDHMQNHFKKSYWLPNIRYINKINQHSSLWLSMSKTYRVPSIAEHSLDVSLFTLPAFIAENPSPWPVETRFLSNHNFKAESIKSFEMGARTTVNPSFNIDMAFFYTEYEKLRSTTLAGMQCENTQLLPPLCAISDTIINGVIVTNESSATSYGFESYANWLINQSLSVKFNYSFLDMEHKTKNENVIVDSSSQIYYRHNFSVIVDWQISSKLDMRASFNYRDDLEQGIDAQYDINEQVNALNLSINYQLMKNSTVYFKLDNLFNDKNNQWYSEHFSGHVSQVKQQVIFGFETTY